MGKSRFSPTTRRFAGLPGGPCLYAALLTNGIIKIGYTQSATGRMIALASEVRRHFNADIEDFHIEPRHCQIGGRAAEVRALAAFSKIGQLVSGRKEYFEGASFSQAKSAIRRQANPDDLADQFAAPRIEKARA